MLFGTGRRVSMVLACSICGNLLFLFLLILGYYSEVADHTELVAPDCGRCDGGVLCFCAALSGSELARMTPNTIYVASDGVHRARFEFLSGNTDVLKEIGIMDNLGRPWINVSLEDGTLIYNRYADDAETDPVISLIDKDRDGIPDAMIDWELETRFDPRQELTWRPTN